MLNRSGRKKRRSTLVIAAIANVMQPLVPLRGHGERCTQGHGRKEQSTEQAEPHVGTVAGESTAGNAIPKSDSAVTFRIPARGNFRLGLRAGTSHPQAQRRLLRRNFNLGETIMTARRIPVLALLAFLSSMVAASAQTTFTFDLTPQQETAAPMFTMSGGGGRPPSSGNATLVLNATMTELTMTVTIFNIDITGTQTPGDTNDNLAAAHIHANATNTLGFNAPVVWGFFGSPDNDNNPDQLVVTPFASGVGGTFTSIWDAPEGNSTTLAAQVNNILNGHAYLNFHTAQNGGGEIRGQIVIPEPSTTALLVVGALGGVAAFWKRRRG